MGVPDWGPLPHTLAQTCKLGPTVPHVASYCRDLPLLPFQPRTTQWGCQQPCPVLFIESIVRGRKDATHHRGHGGCGQGLRVLQRTSSWDSPSPQTPPWPLGGRLRRQDRELPGVESAQSPAGLQIATTQQAPDLTHRQFPTPLPTWALPNQGWGVRPRPGPNGRRHPGCFQGQEGWVEYSEARQGRSGCSSPWLLPSFRDSHSWGSALVLAVLGSEIKGWLAAEVREVILTGRCEHGLCGRRLCLPRGLL